MKILKTFLLILFLVIPIRAISQDFSLEKVLSYLNSYFFQGYHSYLGENGNYYETQAREREIVASGEDSFGSPILIVKYSATYHSNGKRQYHLVESAEFNLSKIASCEITEIKALRFNCSSGNCSTLESRYYFEGGESDFVKKRNPFIDVLVNPKDVDKSLKACNYLLKNFKKLSDDPFS